MKVFISHAKEQADLAEKITVKLRARGHKVFFDEHTLAAGAEYDNRIRKAILGCDLFIFMISPESVRHGSYATH